MRFILETKLGKLKVNGIKFRTFEDWCLDDKKRCLNNICVGEWRETDQGIEVYGVVSLEEKQLKQIPFKFYRVENGSFYIFNNLLTSLIGSPEYVDYSFDATYNKLQNLINGPKEINENYHIGYNQIVSLEGSPEKLEDDFVAPHNKLQNLVGGPEIVKGDYYVAYNQINSLEGAPKYVEGHFFIHNQQIPPGKKWTEEEVREKTEVELGIII